MNNLLGLFSRRVIYDSNVHAESCYAYEETLVIGFHLQFSGTPHNQIGVTCRGDLKNCTCVISFSRSLDAMRSTILHPLDHWSNGFPTHVTT